MSATEATPKRSDRQNKQRVDRLLSRIRMGDRKFYANLWGEWPRTWVAMGDPRPQRRRERFNMNGQ